MTKDSMNKSFQSLNRGYDSVFHLGKMSVGLVVPIEHYISGPIPSMESHLERILLAEESGFSSIWLRDVPFNVPTFGDAGQPFDAFAYLGYLAAKTSKIAIGVASIILPLRHPAHVAKSAASIDVLSDGRLILGVASGDRPQEYPATNLDYSNRGLRFRESFSYIRQMQENYPSFDNSYGKLTGEIDMLPKPKGTQLPMLITGGSQQEPTWIAENGDGWMIYPQQPQVQEKVIKDWQSRVNKAGRGVLPVMQPLYFDLVESPNTQPSPLHLGFRSGSSYLIEYLKALEQVGVNHVALNLRFNQLDIETTLKHLADQVLPSFH